MTRNVLRLIVMAMALTLTAGAGSAQACDEPTLGLGKAQAGPNETVPFSVVNAEAGAPYTITVEGQTVASGTSPGATGLSGTFTMPDLGSDKTAWVELVVEHDKTTYRSFKSIEFRVPAPAPAQRADPSPPAPVPAPQSAPVTSQTPAAATSPSQPGAGAPAALDPSVPARRSRPSADRSRGGARMQSRGAADSSAPTRAAVAPVTDVTSAAAATRAADPASSAAPARARGGEVAGPSRTPARALPVHAWGGATSDVSGGATPSVLIALAALFLAGFAGGGYAFVRGRSGGPAPWVPPAVAADARARDALIEAELQEIIAEQRARETLGEPERLAPAESERSDGEVVGAPG